MNLNHKKFLLFMPSSCHPVTDDVLVAISLSQVATSSSVYLCIIFLCLVLSVFTICCVSCPGCVQHLCCLALGVFNIFVVCLALGAFNIFVVCLGMGIFL